MTRHWHIAAWLMLTTMANAQETDLRYRVSGIIVSPEKQLAVIEKSDGTQALFRTGEMLADYEIERIDSGGVILSKSGRQVWLELRGRPTFLADAAAVSAANTLVQSSPSGEATAQVDFAMAREELREMVGLAPVLPEEFRREYQRNHAMQSGKQASAAERERSPDELLNKAMGLPSYAQITKVNRTPVESAQEAARLIEADFALQRTVRLELNGSVAGIEVLYVKPSGGSSPVEDG